MPITFESSVYNVLFLLLYVKLVLYVFVGILTQLCGFNLPTPFSLKIAIPFLGKSYIDIVMQNILAGNANYTILQKCPCD